MPKPKTNVIPMPVTTLDLAANRIPELRARLRELNDATDAIIAAIGRHAATTTSPQAQTQEVTNANRDYVLPLWHDRRLAPKAST